MHGAAALLAVAGQSSTPPPSNTFVGTLYNAVGNPSSITVANVGDLIVMACLSSSGITAVSGGGVTTWNGPLTENPGGGNWITTMWWGIATSAGAQAISVTNAGGQMLWVGEFGGPSGIDTSGGAYSASETTAAFPSLTPAGADELYVAYGGNGGGGFSAGSTPGVQYIVIDGYHMVCYALSVSATLQPTAGQNSNNFEAVGALFKP